jgi:hypothetical protein
VNRNQLQVFKKAAGVIKLHSIYQVKVDIDLFRGALYISVRQTYEIHVKIKMSLYRKLLSVSDCEKILAQRAIYYYIVNNILMQRMESCYNVTIS